MRRGRGTVDLVLGLAVAAAMARIARSGSAGRAVRRDGGHGAEFTPRRADAHGVESSASGDDTNSAGATASGDDRDGARGADSRPAHDHRRGIREWASASMSERGIVDGLLLLLALAAAVADVVAPAGSSLRLVLSGLAALFVPGAAILTLLRPRELLEAATTAIGLSLAVEVIGSLVLIWAGWFHPVLLAGAIAVPSGIALAWDFWRCLTARGEVLAR